MMQSKQAELDLRGLALVGVVVAWLAGIVLEAWTSLPDFALLMGACAALAWLVPLRRDRLGRLTMFAMLCLFLGAWRYAITLPVNDPQNISAYFGAGTIKLQGSVADEPRLEGKSRMLLIAVNSISKNGGATWQQADGQLEAQTLDTQIEDPYGANYGSTVEIQGRLQPPTQYNPPGVFATMAFPRIAVTGSGGNPVIAALYHLRITLATIIAQSLPQPEASLLIAILLSLHTPALNTFISAFNVTGTAHLVAASGFKVTVLWDAGFQLSLLGTLGIVLLTPHFQRLLHPLDRLRGGHAQAEIVSVTLAAQTATLPIIAIDFHQISFIAALTNILTVPLLGLLLFIGILICGTGLIYGQLGIFCGWIALPILWYVSHVVVWCAAIPGAYIIVTNLNTGLSWVYYALLALVVSFLVYKWPGKQRSHADNAAAPLLSQRTWRLLQLGAALIILSATTTTVLATHPDGRLHITFLNVGPANQPVQGEAILVQTPDGKTALIDGGPDAVSLAQALDSRLPSWQRSIDVVLLTTPRPDHLSGLQDVVSRYQVGEVFDAGMLHPSSSYALWRRTIAERNIAYMQVRQGTTLAIGTQVTLQVFWPPSPLHKGGDEELDNALIVRLVAPGLRMLLLGAAAFSKHALAGLPDAIAASYLQADIVQIVAEGSKSFPTELGTLLQRIKPSTIVITPAALSSRQRKQSMATVLNPLPQFLAGTLWQAVQTAQVGAIEISSSNQGWTLNV